MSNHFRARNAALNPITPIASPRYEKFDKLDGSHPWIEQMPDGHVLYRVRELGQGEVSYFNFALAKEMGLLPNEHACSLNRSLRDKILQTFSLQILNEYDEARNKAIDPKTIKSKKYMASRYLQLQHSNKQGKTSGDGRGIWNGIIQHRGKIWDVSSRGTGVTCLSPGSVQAQKNLRTGGTQFGYGCGLAEVDELYGAAIFAEIMHLQGMPTERVLCVIDLGNGFGIGVRAAPNLLRPAHLFRYLKQNRCAELQRGTDYFIDRQKANGRWNPGPAHGSKYESLLAQLNLQYARFAAQLDIDYVFAWLDWDGDNVLLDAGIIDYGSVRQFGLRHDHYRYNDVERFSTNLNEQRQKAQLIVQVFAQMTDFIRTGVRKPMRDFANHPQVKKFNQHFANARADRLLYRMGFNPKQRERILAEQQTWQAWEKEYSYFERAKVSGKSKRVADGVNHPALFNMRTALRLLPEHFLKNSFKSDLMDNATLFGEMISRFARTRDARLRPKHSGHLQNLQQLYRSLVQIAAGTSKPPQILAGILDRARELNRPHRITGNALIQIVNELIVQQRRGLSYADLQKIIDLLIMQHIGLPEIDPDPAYARRPRLVVKPDLWARLLSIIEEHQEDI